MVRTTDTLHESLTELARMEPAFAAVLERHGRPEPRVSPPGATTLLRTIVGQQVSVAEVVDGLLGQVFHPATEVIGQVADESADER